MQNHKNRPAAPPRSVSRKIFRGEIRIDPLLTSKNKIFEIWEVQERVCENPGEPWPRLPPLPTPMAAPTGPRLWHA